MRTLEQFWHWYCNEKPNSRGRRDQLSELAKMVLHQSEIAVAKRSGQPEAAVIALYTDAVRGLSLSLCAALERMREQVPEGNGWKERNDRDHGKPLSATAAQVVTHERSKCIQHDLEANDIRYCRECLSKPCRRARDRGVARWTMDHKTDTLTVYTGRITTREQADRLRGLAPKHVRVIAHQASLGDVGCYLVNEVLAPMRVYGATWTVVTDYAP